MDELFAVAQLGSVYGEPVTHEECTVIAASEVSVAMGFGHGMGGGSPLEPATREAIERNVSRDKTGINAGIGSGGGGGGASSGRPVAIINIGPDGVRIQPVVDLT